jgi:hypothetical protein
LKQRRSKSDDLADLDLSNGPVLTPEQPSHDEPVVNSTPAEVPLPDTPSLSGTIPDEKPQPEPEPQPEPLPEPAETPEEPTLALADPLPDALEQRVRRLEEAVALLQQARSVPAAVPSPGGSMTATVPVAVPTATSLAGDRPETPPTALPVTPGSPGGSRPVPTTGNRSGNWLWWEMFIELRVFLRMYTDPRYSMSWFGRTVPMVLILVFVFSSYTIPLASVYGIGWVFQKIGELIVAYGLFKSLSYEARRYRQKAPDLPASLRL